VIKLKSLSEKDIQWLVNSIQREGLDMIEKFRVIGTDTGDLPSNPIDFFAGVTELNAEYELTSYNYEATSRTVDHILRTLKIDLEKDSFEYKKLCREMAIADKKWAEVEQRRNQGDYSDNIDELFPIPSESDLNLLSDILPRSLEKPKEQPAIPLNDVIKEYTKRQVQSKKWRPNTERNHKPKIKAIVQVLGNRPINYITIEDVRSLAKLLELLPPRFARMKEYKDISNLSPKDLEGKHEKTLDVTTRRDYLNLARSIFAHAEENEYIIKNPVISGLIPPKKKNTRGRKLPFDDPSDLDKIFNPDVYLKASNDKPSKFWVPVLALYTGCRREEICQLYTEDVQQIEGIWCLNIKGLTSAAIDDDEDDDQMLKTESTPRIIPLHPFIVDELKFPEYVKRLKNKRDERVFPELKKYNFKYGHKLGDWFNRYIRTKKVGVTNPKKSFHSFRHNIADHLFKKMVPVSLIEELEGRAGKTETEKTYVMGHLIKNLYEQCILKLEYQVDLSHLKKSRFVPK
jgi:integrase